MMTRLLLAVSLLVNAVWVLWPMYDSIERPIEDGTVVSKAVDEPYEYEIQVPVYSEFCNRRGDECRKRHVGFDNRSVMTPYVYWLRIEEKDGRQRVIEVPYKEFTEYDEGEWYDGDGDAMA